MNILIYSTSNCAACHTLTTWLDHNGLQYTRKVTDEDTTAMEEFMNANDGMLEVPFTIITNEKGDQTKISGFEQKKFKEALNMI